MLDWIHSKDKKFLIWIAPWVMGDMAKEAYEKEYFPPTEDLSEVGIHLANQINNFSYLQNRVKPVLIDSIKKMNSDEIDNIIRTFVNIGLNR